MDSQKSVGSYFDDLSSDWGKKYDASANFKDRLDTVQTYLPQNLEGKRVLDMGCGSGIFTEVLKQKGATVIALDLSLGMLQQIQHDHRVQGQVDALPFATQDFDGVVSMGVVEYVPNPKGFFEESARLIKPGGFFLFSMPNPKSLYRKLEKPFALISHMFKPQHPYLKYLRLSRFHNLKQAQSWMTQLGFSEKQHCYQALPGAGKRSHYEQTARKSSRGMTFVGLYHKPDGP